ncbi:E3 ubiquitin-protein ligase TRIM35 [Eublepharis macularius]|uniref:E3 ubiquitin-protein ligase TRIM35 n=1 Tax=Eublepharis macularius TaxID=481883 RepID=A0AA97JUV4_EUBMA|nr:E3 ubiquitin-protein ligase TRIM35 [Eublepharis macularius]
MAFFPGNLARSPRRRSSRICCQRCLPTPCNTTRAMAKQTPAASSLASSLPTATIKEELLCPICYEPFKDAVTLRCGHNFCKGCVGRSWENQTRHVCPVCKATSSLEDLRTNHTLANIVEMFLKQEKNQQRQAGETSALCSLHREEARLFCLDDKELVCFVCQNSKQHADHKMRPVEEIAKDYRAKCKDMERSLWDKMQEFGRVQSSYREIAKHNKVESARLEKEIKKQFEHLHEFLQREEKAMLEELQAETQQKKDLIEDKIKKLSEESNILQQEVDHLQADQKDDDVSFLQKHKNRKRRIAWTAEEPEAIPPGMLIEITKYLDSLQYNTWKKMLDIIKVVPFSFDSNTSTGRLAVSDDLTSISTGNYKLSVGVPESFSAGLPCVLGSKSFAKGSHAWEVDIGGINNWCIGVARKHCGYQWSFGSDSYLGFTYMYRMQGASNKRDRSSKSILMGSASGKDLKKVRVELDCDEGELSFYNAEHKSHIYTFHDNFGEVVPYFSICAVDAVESSSESLKLCPLQVQIKEDYPD